MSALQVSETLHAQTAGTVPQRVARWAEAAHFELVLDLVDEWADLQTERLVREILGRGLGWYRADRDYAGAR